MGQYSGMTQFEVSGRIFALTLRPQEFNLQLKREFKKYLQHGLKIHG